MLGSKVCAVFVVTNRSKVGIFIIMLGLAVVKSVTLAPVRQTDTYRHRTLAVPAGNSYVL